MALSQSVASELLEAFRAGEGVDLIRESVRLVMQELIETEATERIGADRYERTGTRATDRNGSRPRLVATQAGDVELRIPKLRKGSFFPAIFAPRRRIDQALYAVVMEAYVNGVSTRAVDDLVAALGVESGISKSEVSRICAGLDEQVEAFRSRPLHHTPFPYVFLDATYLHVRRTGQVTSMAVVVATGVTATGGREVLGLDVGDSEDEVFWRGFLRTVKQRALAGVQLVISDQHAGLVAALGRVFQGEPSWVWWKLGLLDLDQGLVAPLGSVERLLELRGRDVAEVAVQALVVVPVDPAEGGELKVLDALPGSWPGGPADQLGLVVAVHGLGQSIVIVDPIWWTPCKRDPGSAERMSAWLHGSARTTRRRIGGRRPGW